MKKIKSIISLMLAAVLAIFISGCKENEEETNYKDLYGIAIYQKTNDNKNWSTYSKKPNKISNLFSTENGEIDYFEETEFLFYVYAKNPIDLETKTEDYISNTTITSPSISDNTLTITMERIKETSEVLIFYIYKTKDNFIVEYAQTETISENTDKTIELKFNNASFSKIKLQLMINLSTSKKY